MQTVLLVLGGLLLAGASLVLTVAAFSSVGPAAGSVLLALITAVALALPVVLVRHGLMATAETLAAVALILVLLDGYVAWTLRLFGGTAVSASTYFGLVCVAAAVVSIVYHATTRLVAPRFATLIVLQPVLGLLAYPTAHGFGGFAIIFAGVALLDLGFATGTLRLPTAGFARSLVSGPESPGASEVADAFLNNLAWALFGLAYVSGLFCAGNALANESHLGPAVALAALLLAVAALGVVGGAVWRTEPVPTVTGAVASIAAIAAVTKIGTVAMPHHTLLFLSCGVVLTALATMAIPTGLARGPVLACTLAEIAAGVLFVVAALPAITAPVRASFPLWQADLSTYSARVAEAAGPGAWQLVAAGLLLSIAAAITLPNDAKPDGVVVGATLTMMSAPAAFALSWIVTPAIAVATAVAIVAIALNVARARTASTCLACAIVLTAYATCTGLTRPPATALTLAAIAIAGTAIAFAPRATREDGDTERVVGRITDVAGGGALFAFPGAVASAATALMNGSTADSTAFILVMASFAVAVSIGAVALAQLSRGQRGFPLLLGATLATVGLIVATFLAPGSGIMDILVGILMAIAVALLWMSPAIDERQSFGNQFSGADIGCAALTVAFIAAVSRLATLLAPGVELLSIAVLVLVIAVAIQILPEGWRRGPVAGGALVGLFASVCAGALAIVGTVGVIRASTPFWNAAIGAAWTRAAREYLSYGIQVPLTLLLLAAAAAVALPRRYSDAAAAGSLALASASMPVGFGLGWSSPMIIGWTVITGLGIASALATNARSAHARLVVAAVLAVETLVASLARPEATVGTLFALAGSGVLVAVLAAAVTAYRRRSSAAPPAYLTIVGGSNLAFSLVAATGAVTAMTMASGRPQGMVATATLASAAVGVGLCGILCQRHRDYLPFVAIASGVLGILIVATAAPSAVPIAVYASAAALIGVLAELLRAGRRIPRDSPAPSGISMAGQRVEGFGFGVAAVCGIPAAIAVLSIAPSVVAALLGPYQWLAKPWKGTPETGADLGWFSDWTANGSDVLAAVVLTIAAILVAVGLGGGSNVIANRAVAVIVPGVAVTLLIMPIAFQAPYPAGPMASLVVAAIAGLAIALTVPCDRSEEGAASLLAGRRLVLFIAIGASGAGMAGSLATAKQTMIALGSAVVVALFAALRGRTEQARVAAWQVTSGAALLLALAVGLDASLTPAQCSYPILLASGVLIGLMGVIRGFHETPTLEREIIVVESIAYAGALGAVALTIGSIADTAAICFDVGAFLGLAAARPQRQISSRGILIFGAAASEVAALLLMFAVDQPRGELYTLPFALLALTVGLADLRRRPDTGSASAYGPALVAAFAPTLFMVVSTDATTVRRVILIAAAVVTVAVGAWVRQKAPVVIGSAVTAIATMHELVLLGRLLPWHIMLILFTAAGVLLVGLGASYERRRQNVQRIRGAFDRMR